MVIILPTIGKDLDIPEARLQWILSAYSLTFGCFMLFWGRVADIYGKRKIFVLGSAWFAATTLVNPFLPNEIAFDLFRGLQGLVSWEHSLFCIGEEQGLLTTWAGRRCKCSDRYRHSRDHVPTQQGQELCLQLLWYGSRLCDGVSAALTVEQLPVLRWALFLATYSAESSLSTPLGNGCLW